MRILESIFNILFAIADCWQKTRDPLLNEYRCYIRRVITFTFMSIFFLILSTLISPTDEGLHAIAVIMRYFSQGLAILSMLSILAAAWCSIAFYLFIRENGFWE